MKIVHITSGCGYGATAQQFERLVSALQKAGVNQRLIAPGAMPEALRLKAAGVETIALDLPGTFAFLDRRKINAELKRFTPDIVMSWTPAAGVLVERGAYLHVGRAPLVFDPASANSCSALLAPSQQRADGAAGGGFAAAAVHVIPHLPAATLNAGPVTAFDRKKLFTPATSRLIFSAARLVDDKGIADLLGAIARLSSVYLWIAGDGADRAALEERAYALGIKPRVRFLGWQDDLRPYFAAADVFVYPARKDDLGDAVVEGWAAGMPVVAADSLGPGLLIRHQENGLLVPVGDVQSLSEAIKFLLVEPDVARRLGAAGRAAYEDSFTPERLAPRYLETLQGLLARTGAS